MEEYTPTEGEVHLEPKRENMTSEQPGVQPVTKQQRKKGKDKQQEGEEDEFVSEEAFSVWKKHYAGKGFVGKRGFSQLISPFKELIEQRGGENSANIKSLDMQQSSENFTPIWLEGRRTLFMSKEFGCLMERRLLMKCMEWKGRRMDQNSRS